MSHKNYKGFTIVELLIVIVVIAILATIAIISYNGIKSRAQESATIGDLSSYAKLIENSRTTNTSGAYPLDIQSTGLSVQAQSSVYGYDATPTGTAYPSSRAGIVSSGSSGWALSILNNGTVKMDVGNKSLQGLNVPLNTCVHVSMYYDPSNGDYGRYGLRATVFGANNSSNTFSEDVAPTTLTYGAIPCYIGSYRNDSATFFNGSIDDVRLCGPYNGSTAYSCTASGL